MCEIDFDDGEPVTVWREKAVRARKPYRCDCCGGPIAAGEEYVRHFSVCDGYGSDEKLCAACRADRQLFSQEHDGAMFNPSSFREYLSNCIDPHDPESVEKWTPMLEGMRARWTPLV